MLKGDDSNSEMKGLRGTIPKQMAPGGSCCARTNENGAKRSTTTSTIRWRLGLACAIGGILLN